MRQVGAILAGAVLLVWPALLNHYPLVFIDTAAYLLHTTAGQVPWDKTAAYGPFLHVFHQGQTLWAPLAAQGLILSWLLWRVQLVAVGHVSARWHLALVAVLAVLTSAPWFASMLMPDFFTPVLVLSLFLLGFADTRLSLAETLGVGVLAALGLAVHLSHLPTALALLGLVALLRWHWRPVLRTALPLLAALLFLIGANWQAFGRATLSAHGAVFLLARLQDDGPAVLTLRERCPQSGWYMCDFLDRLPMDSDVFLWSPTSPPASDAAGTHRPMGAVLLAPEAAAIVAATLHDHPVLVARAMLGNWGSQLGRMRVGDMFDNMDLDEFETRILARGFPPAELRRFAQGRQMQGRLEALAEPLTMVQVPLVGAALLVTLLALWRIARAGPRRGPMLGLMACVLLGIAANAFATGALSKPHARYQARIIWLLPLAAALAWRAGVFRPMAAPPRAP